MPEGPEIRRAADRVAEVLVGGDIVDVYFGLPRLRRYINALQGRVVVSVDTLGKAMLTRFDNGLTLYSHNQLYGVWHTALRGHAPKTSRSLRVALSTATHSALLYSASDIDVLTQRQIAEHPFLKRAGPDILDTRTTAADVAARLNDRPFRGRATGSLYLDQSFMAGVGNYLRSEILFAAGVHHLDKPAQLNATARNRLALATLRISRRSYRTGGVTVTRQLARILRREGADHAHYRFWVYGRAGLPCRVCGTPIETSPAGARTLYFCPGCQVRCC